MADIYFKCEHCQKSLAVDETGAGKKVKCSDCGKPITIPHPEIECDCDCGKPMLAPKSMAGEKVQCVECNEYVEIPALPSQKLSLKKQEPPESLQCPSCGAPIKSDYVLCVNCGLNFKTGKKAKLVVDTDATKKVPLKPVIIAVSIVVVCGFGITWWMMMGKKGKAPSAAKQALVSTNKISSQVNNITQPEKSVEENTVLASKLPDEVIKELKGMSESDYFQYLKVIADNANDSAGIEKAKKAINTYLTAFPTGKNKSSVIAYQEILQGKVGQLDLLQIKPLMDEYEAIRAGFSSGMSYVSFSEAYKRALTEYNKLESVIDFETSKYVALKKIHLQLNILKSVWDRKIELERDYTIYFIIDQQYPLMSSDYVSELVKVFPLLKDAGLELQGENRFAFKLGVPIIMSHISNEIEKAGEQYSNNKPK